MQYLCRTTGNTHRHLTYLHIPASLLLGIYSTDTFSSVHRCVQSEPGLMTSEHSHVPGSVLCASYATAILFLITILRGRYYYHPLFYRGETQGQERKSKSFQVKQPATGGVRIQTQTLSGCNCSFV